MKANIYRIRKPDGSKRLYCRNPLQLERKYFEGYNPVEQLTVAGWKMWTGKNKRSKYTR